MTDIDTGTETVLGEIRAGVGVITLNRPERRNALHAEMYDAVPRLLDRFFADDEGGCMGRDGGTGGARRGEPKAPVSAEEAGAALAEHARMVLMLHEGPKISI